MNKLEAIQAITKYIDDLVNQEFTGELILNFHKGSVSNKVHIRQSDEL